MSRRKTESVEMQFYEIPQGETVLACCGGGQDGAISPLGGEANDRLHFHNLMEIGICRRGNGMLWLDEEKREYGQDTLVIIPANFPHAVVSAGGKKTSWEFLFFHLEDAVAECCPDNVFRQNNILQALSRQAQVFSRMEAPAFAQMMDAILKEQENRLPYYRQMVRNYLCNLVMEMMRHYPELSENSQITGKCVRIAAALDYINGHYAHEIKVSDLADACGLSESHFRRIFKEDMNMAPMEYINFVRVQKACEMIKKTHNPMEYVAAQCGFSTQSTFSRNFRKFMDDSPGRWKMNLSDDKRK